MNKYDKNGLRHGLWEQYYSKDKLWYRENYINGIEHGLWERYSPNGPLWYCGKFINGIQIGFWIVEDKTYFYL